MELDVYNCGAGVPFQGWKTRLTGFQQFLATLNDTQIVVLLDGGDVMYAGCDMGFFFDGGTRNCVRC